MLKIAKYLILLMGLAQSASTDGQKRLIPNENIRRLLCIRGVLLLLEMMCCENNRVEELLKAAEGFLLIGSLLFVFYFLVGKAMGAGDVKLLAVVGAYCGYERTLWIILFATIFAAVDGAFRKCQAEFPFAPYIFLGTLYVIAAECLKVL